MLVLRNVGCDGAMPPHPYPLPQGEGEKVARSHAKAREREILLFVSVCGLIFLET